VIVRGILDAIARDRIFEEWSAFAPGHVPAPSVIAACREVANEETILRLVRRLAFESKLVDYSKADHFFQLVKIFGQAAAERA
jgi:hypothetical protein